MQNCVYVETSDYSPRKLIRKRQQFNEKLNQREIALTYIYEYIYKYISHLTHMLVTIMNYY